MTVSATVQLARWRRVCAQRDAGQPLRSEDAEWLADVCRDAVDAGKPLRAAFGLPVRGGPGSLATVARLSARDALLRDVRRTYFAAMAPREAARAILEAAHRIQRPRSRERHVADEALRPVIACGELPGERQLARILRDIQTPI